jgi:hypothetical protein
MATCHPERTSLAGGLCSTCYRQEWRKDPSNAEREREWSRTHRQKRTPQQRFQRILYKYKMTIEDWHTLLLAQSGRCDACEAANPDLQIDHCHDTGAVRGLLCPNCNSALGHARDDAVRLRALIDYLGRTSARGLQLDAKQT